MSRTVIRPDLPDVTHYVVYWRSYVPGQFAHWLNGAEVFEVEATMMASIADGAVATVQRVVSFNAAEGWSRDISEDVARTIADQRYASRDPVERHLLDFLEAQLGVVGCRSLVLEDA